MIPRLPRPAVLGLALALAAPVARPDEPRRVPPAPTAQALREGRRFLATVERLLRVDQETYLDTLVLLAMSGREGTLEAVRCARSLREVRAAIPVLRAALREGTAADLRRARSDLSGAYVRLDHALDRLARAAAAPQ